MRRSACDDDACSCLLSLSHTSFCTTLFLVSDDTMSVAYTGEKQDKFDAKSLQRDIEERGGERDRERERETNE